LEKVERGWIPWQDLWIFDFYEAFYKVFPFFDPYIFFNSVGETWSSLLWLFYVIGKIGS